MGMVLEFDYRKVIGCFGQPYIVGYQGEIPEVNLVSGDPQAIIQLMCTKSSEWEYEQELRIVQPHNGHKLHYNPFALRRIIFGCNTYKEDIEKVKSALHNHSHIIFSQCYMDNSSRMLFVKDID